MKHFKFMVTNSDVVSNSNLRQVNEKYGIAQDLIVIPKSKSKDYKISDGKSGGWHVVLDNQQSLPCLNYILKKLKQRRPCYAPVMVMTRDGSILAYLTNYFEKK